MTAPTGPGIVIVGAGTAGVTAATTLRADGYDGPVTVIGAESGLPYRRTALSKDLLAADLSEGRIALQKPEFWAQKTIDVRAGVRVTGIDVDARTVSLDDGASVRYRALIVATGGRPIRPGWLDPAVPTLRTRADAAAIRDDLSRSQRLVVIGGGLIGLELAASVAAHGMTATVVEAADRVVGRVVPHQVSDYLAGLHVGNGVWLRTASVADSATARRVQLTDGTQLVGTVVAAIGARPDVALAEGAGLAVGPHGIVVDSTLATSAPGVYAAGDAAALPDLRTGEPARGEHWFGATDQGRAAAKSVLADLAGTPAPSFTEVPRAWTIQYGVNVQMVGWPTGTDDVRIEGSLGDGDALVTTYDGDDLIGAVAVGRAAAARACRSEIAAALGSRV
ncbi:NAD(P)/FAD-dependent oxidoreductase [Gordonia hydrophobica]|uniref:FAD-dependent oxidoreductase n=1 Tax=Gordonia hydrophobica TaxID=40516 RepID=A0ABZ2U6C9_9ACTN|nr:FAD-dependent oxidoreductase [Gordonia hydrophobica]MBM7365623.1 NADPH-dependent 2,4-dienoyl-CoA reductase/sulfur reductase-like enzyme [Gordonia hydrophobica]